MSSLLTAISVLIGLSPSHLVVQAEQRQSLRERLVKQFDKDGDGKLSAEERAAARKVIQQRRGRESEQRQPQRMTWKVAGLDRTALVYLPTKKSETPSPLVFGFHGHGGNSRNAARTFRMHQLWPEATVVYMQGVPTAGRLTDPEGKRNGWQHSVDENGARDLKFFDVVFSDLKTKFKVDENRVYALGHSNGGGFTYLLWATRPKVFAAIAPSSAGSRSLRVSTPQPVPVMHIAGKKDRLVLFSWQELTMDRVRSINKAGKDGKPWSTSQGATIYTSDQGPPFVTVIHPGTHKYYAAANPLIVKFFKENTRTAVAKK